MKTLKALSALLIYPTPPLLAALPDIHAVIVEEATLDRGQRDNLKALMHWMSEQDPLDLEAAYVDVFDRGRSTSLHLFEHVHGDSRDRGTAMVDLLQVYERAGFRLAGNELPDYLPALLEFLSTRPMAEVQDMLGDCAHILRKLGETLQARDSRYAAIFAALLALVGEETFGAGKPIELAPNEKSLDEEWAEEPVIFGPEAAPACAAARPSVSVVHFHRTSSPPAHP